MLISRQIHESTAYNSIYYNTPNTGCQLVFFGSFYHFNHLFAVHLGLGGEVTIRQQ